MLSLVHWPEQTRQPCCFPKKPRLTDFESDHDLTLGYPGSRGRWNSCPRPTFPRMRQTLVTLFQSRQRTHISTLFSPWRTTLVQQTHEWGSGTSCSFTWRCILRKSATIPSFVVLHWPSPATRVVLFRLGTDHRQRLGRLPQQIPQSSMKKETLDIAGALREGSLPSATFQPEIPVCALLVCWLL